jgi:membrane protein implicated in regulation of membrane protease activity
MVAAFWIVLAVVLGAAEMVTGTVVLVMLAVGALAATVPAALGLPVWLQALTFAIVSVLTLAGVRPAIQRRIHRSGESAPMGLQAIEGSAGLVLEKVDLDHGLVKIDGELWSARPYDGTETFETGERVRVIEVRGATALVWKE